MAFPDSEQVCRRHFRPVLPVCELHARHVQRPAPGVVLPGCGARDVRVVGVAAGGSCGTENTEWLMVSVPAACPTTGWPETTQLASTSMAMLPGGMRAGSSARTPGLQ